MNKKGFTLVELMVSITLLSIVLIFMMNTLVKLRDTNIAEGVETNLIVMQALIGKEINTDVLKNGGISSYSSGILTLGTNQYRKISYTSDNKNIKYEICSDSTCNTTIDTLINKTIEDGYKFGTINYTTLSNLKKLLIPVKTNDDQDTTYNIEVFSYNNAT